MKKTLVSVFACMALLLTGICLLLPAVSNAAGEETAYPVTGTGDAALSAWATGDYSYLKLQKATELALNGETVVIDLAGNDLHITGSGNLQVFDTANDTYDHTLCGLVTAGEDVVVKTVLDAPNGSRYVALTEGQYTTAHRLEMKLTAISLRTSCAGIYYQASFSCDRFVEEKIGAYGLVVSAQDMPRDDFETAEDDLYTVMDKKDFVSGATVNSGIIANILRDDPDVNNTQRMDIAVYARVYMKLDDTTILSNTGATASLQSLMNRLDEQYGNFASIVQGQLDDFYKTWKNQGTDWSFANIGKEKKVIDNSALQFQDETTNAWCPVCEKTVQWQALQESSVMQVAQNGAHYYLQSNLTFTGSGSGVYAYMQAPGSTGQTACVHLNGYELTSTKVPAFHGSNGVLNIMGEGVVTGTQDSSEKGKGAAIQTNNKIKTNAVNLYGGIYRKSDASHANAGVLGIRAGGGGIFVYEGATIDAASGYAIYIGAPTSVDHRLGLYGCTVNGDVGFLLPANESYQTKAELKDCTINGTVTATESMTVTLAGKLDIDKIVVPEEARLTTKGLAQGSVVGIEADGAFITPSSNVGDYTELFVAAQAGKKIILRGDTLYCDKDYTSDLSFTEGTTAYCPVCESDKTWTPLTAGTEPFKPTLGEHYYLAESLTYTGSGAAYIIMNGGAGKTVCIHLNGNNITAPNSRVFYGSSSILNVMGTGVVSGRVPDTYGPGSVVQNNTSNVNGTINLYSGTYRQAEGAATTEYTVNLHDAGKINVYRDAEVIGNVSGNAYRIAMPRSNNASGEILGAYLDGNVQLEGANAEKGYTVGLTLDDATVTGTLDINGTNTVKVLHGTTVSLLDMESTTKLTLDRLTEDAKITVKNAGAFAESSVEADRYISCFRTAQRDDKILNKDGVLTYKVNYTGKLLLNSDGQAWCPVCMQTVTWTALTDNDTLNIAQNGYHYYLTGDVEHTGTSTAYLKAPETKNHTACFHLNGYNLTATALPAIYGSSGVLNVMGNGVVSGYGGNNRGAALQVNNYLTNVNAVNLYSGTYRKGDNAAAGSYVIGYGTNGGGVYIYEDARIEASGDNAIYVGFPHASGDNKLGLFDCTIDGNIQILAPDAARTTKTVVSGINAAVNGNMSVYGSHDITFRGRTKLSKLTLAAGTIVEFADMLSGSQIGVSASGIFTTPMEQADDWLQYFSIDSEGDMLIVRDKCLYQGPQQQIPEAVTEDISTLDTIYAGREVRYGEMHDHSNSGPKADGFQSIATWKTKMAEIGMDFTTIVDHRQSVHMYDSDWDSSMFIGGSEPSAYIQGWPDGNRNMHYNMIFADAADLESLVKAFEGFEYVDAEDGKGGTWVTDVPSFTELEEQAAMVRQLGGFFVAVHPKYDSYIKSDDPLDYYFGDYTGIEITTGTGGNMCYQDNEEAYQLWLDLLDMGKKVYATAGSDFHALPNASALTTLYGSDRDAQAYVDIFRSGDFAPGWVGIRMAMGDTTMGGTGSFTGQRLVFSVGDMYDVQLQDSYGSYYYKADHTYCVQLYDDSGLLMESAIDPAQMQYFAVDADAEAKFYRIVVWDQTENTRVGVSNPIWNSDVAE